MGNQDLLERSFTLAESGRMKDIRDIRFALIREGFSYAELGQLGGKALSRQIIAKIASARLRQRAAEK